MTVDQAYGYLGQSLAAGRLAQGYVIEAPPRGSGMELANRLMALLFCKDSAAPCGFCQGCKGVEKGTHPDLHRIEPEKKSRVIAVDAMRLFQQAFSRTSFAGGWKVGLIISADCCHASSANAFLKTLEEPPEQTVFLLLTDQVQRLLPTIISRCQRISLTGQDELLPPGEAYDAVIATLRKLGHAGRIGAMAASSGICALLKMQKDALVKEEKAAAREEEQDIDSETIDGRAGARYREVRQQVLMMILCWLRDGLLLFSGSEADLLRFGSEVPFLRATQPGSYQEGLRRIRVFESAITQLNRNMPEALTLGQAFLSLYGE
jgi:DNA polymerase III subunit delta'